MEMLEDQEPPEAETREMLVDCRAGAGSRLEAVGGRDAGSYELRVRDGSGREILRCAQNNDW